MMRPGGESAGLVHYSSDEAAFADESLRLSKAPYINKSMEAMVLTYCPPVAGQVYTYWPHFEMYYSRITAYENSYAALMPMISAGVLDSSPGM